MLRKFFIVNLILSLAFASIAEGKNSYNQAQSTTHSTNDSRLEAFTIISDDVLFLPNANRYIYSTDKLLNNNHQYKSDAGKILNQIYPKIKVPLKSRNVFTLLISVLLSAQCTDINVNNVTKNIYPKYHKPKHFIKLGRKNIEKLIRKIGIFRVKAKSIYNLSKIINKRYNGKVPKTFKELEELPGVGHKTASVVMSQGFGYPAFAIDTHIHRLAQRWGLTNGKNVFQTEKDLKKIFPKKNWNKLHLQIIYYGREYCKARDCYGLTCKICTTCYPNRKKPVKTNKA